MEPGTQQAQRYMDGIMMDTRLQQQQLDTSSLFLVFCCCLHYIILTININNNITWYFSIDPPECNESSLSVKNV
jgi:hypothetical protein